MEEIKVATDQLFYFSKILKELRKSINLEKDSEILKSHDLKVLHKFIDKVVRDQSFVPTINNYAKEWESLKLVEIVRKEEILNKLGGKKNGKL